MKRRIILVCISSILAAGSLFAQTAAPTVTGKARAKQVQTQCRKEAKKHFVKFVLKKLDLTADQKARIKELNKQAVAQVNAVKADTSVNAEQKKAKIIEIRKAEWQQVKSLLTPEQLQKLEALMAKAKKRCK